MPSSHRSLVSLAARIEHNHRHNRYHHFENDKYAVSHAGASTLIIRASIPQVLTLMRIFPLRMYLSSRSCVTRTCCKHNYDCKIF